MNKPARIVAPLLIAYGLAVAACTSSTSGGGANDGGGSGSGSGGGTVSGVGACVLYLDDGGNPAASGTTASCLITSIDGKNAGPPCSTGLTYATSCPTLDLTGCCTVRGASDPTTTVLIDTCSYSSLGEPASQLQAACVAPAGDGGLGGTWSTTP